MTHKNERQQGDVLINRIEILPNDLKKIDKKPRGFVLAEGETTGHAHVIDDGIEMFEATDGTLYIRVMKEKAVLTHEEHASIELPRGLYEIGIVQEVDPWTEQPRNVVD
jgi:hypothetical protein